MPQASDSFHIIRALNTIRNELSSTRADAFLISNLTNLQYFSGMKLSSGSMLVTRSSAALFVDDRYYDEAKTIASDHVMVKHARSFRASLKHSKRCCIESSLTLSAHKRLKQGYPKVQFIPTDNVCEQCRRTKSDIELQYIAQACAITKTIFTFVPEWLTQKTTEIRLARKIRDKAEQLGAHDMAFDTIVAFGEHSSVPHHRPTERALQRGDVVQIDCGVKVSGYCSDFSRVFFTAPLTKEQRNAYSALTHTLQTCTQMVRPGVYARALDTRARTELKRFGFEHEFCHALGHGVGLDIHEGIILSHTTKRNNLSKLLKHEVITIEPGLYFAGKWGMRIEDTIVVK